VRKQKCLKKRLPIYVGLENPKYSMMVIFVQAMLSKTSRTYLKNQFS